MEGRCSRAWAIQLFGRFHAKVGNRNLESLPGRRTKELLSYLLLFRDRPHHREVLAATLWPESGTTQSRKYLRQSLWHLRTFEPTDDPMLSTDSEWVQANSTNLWLDVAELEGAFGLVRLQSGDRFDAEIANVLKRASAVYRGDLLEGCYEDWCIYERERLKAMYISLLERLLAYCESHDAPEEGLIYGEKLLCHDPAHERAHWRLMRLRYLLGDRTGALRQFERCRAALNQELGVAPGERTRALYEQIRADADIAAPTEAVTPSPAFASSVAPTMELAGFWPEPGASQPPSPAAEGLQLATAPLQRALQALSLAGKLVEQSIQAVQQQEPAAPRVLVEGRPPRARSER